MLDVKDLRIGNLTTNAGGIIIKITPEKISDLSNKLIILNPIELTEEWLLKFGFIDEDLQMSGHKWLVYKRTHLHKMDIRIAIPKIDNDWSLTLECVSPPTMTLSHLQYVHQLQNLYYALTQTELTLKDEK